MGQTKPWYELDLKDHGQSALDDPVEFITNLQLGNSSQLVIDVPGHAEEDGHTYYQISCALASLEDATKIRRSWSCKKRLCDIREKVLDIVVEEVSENYEVLFASAPFALRGGLPGTTARLSGWFARLAEYINDGKLSPQLCVMILDSLES